ncbi:MAG: ornithine cyclodeaminase family protein [Nitratireductor sp.]|nr:ornithine cyclodeaminase family protein [Nitratireductor sp.]
MLMLDAETTRNSLPMKGLVEALRSMFRQGCEMPVRHHHFIEMEGEDTAKLLLMPAWISGQYVGVKIANVFPGNSARGMAAVNASYMLMSGATGQNLALIDGGELTARRTAAASALAADYLARKDASHLLVVATGRLALNIVEAYQAVRKLDQVTIWGRNTAKAEAVAQEVRAMGINASAARDLEAAVGKADMISCATLSSEPLILGEWLQPGQHLDLIGAFTTEMRESDDECMRRASVFVDTMAGGTKEAGDIVLAIKSGALSADAIKADLFGLTRKEHPGRASEQEITLFKSVGAALEDLAGAILAYETNQ